MSKPQHDVVSINDILGRQVVYRIPLYQRGYSWDEVNFRELWEDIRDTMTNKSDLFLGSIILSRKSDSTDSITENYEVVDGQQRLITFTIFLRVIHDLVSAEKQQDRFQRELYRLIAGDDSSYKLVLGKEDEDFFSRFIKQKDRESNKKGVKRSHKMIRKAYDLFKTEIQEEIKRGKFDSRIQFLDELFESIKLRTQFLIITVNNEFDAYAIFESINAKRVDLTPAELIKNYVFSTASENKQTLDKLQQSWEDVLDKLSPSNKEIAITQFIRHYWISTYSDVREKELYRAIKNRFKGTTTEIPQYVQDLSSASAMYAAIIYPEMFKNLDSGITVTRLEVLNRFNFKQSYPLLLSLLMSNPTQESFDKLVGILEAAILRRSLTGNNPNELEDLLSKCAREISKNGEKSLNSIIKEIAKSVPPDADIKTAIISNSYTPNSRVILEEFEKAQSTGEKDIKNPTIEHIMPKVPQDYLSWGVSTEEHEFWLQNIGNLTLLGRPLNSSAKNSDFYAKCSIYKNSEYRITNSLCEYDNWSIKEINQRAKNIAEFVIKYWKIPEL